ncbi:MAG TPA: hypothetical protein VJN93_10460 [Candidatus Acidoferrum sp.]|nr:hypothetical protein [Candidatus Acidoferrum sp.]
MNVRTTTLKVALLWLAAAMQTAAQEIPRPTPAALRAKEYSRPVLKKRHMVWTNDDLIAMRTPEDLYLQAREKESEVLQRKASTSSDAKDPIVPAVKLPATIAATEQSIREDQQDVYDAKEKLAELSDQLSTAPEDQKPGKQSEITRRTGILQATERELKVLEEHLEKLRAQQAGANSNPRL